MLVRDFNAHNSLRGSTTIDSRGLEIADFVQQSKICLMNTKDSTYNTYTQQQAYGVQFTRLTVIPHFSLNTCGLYMMINVVVITM
jgi:hypothetical protein